MKSAIVLTKQPPEVKLFRYDAVCRAIELAKSVDEVKDIHNKAIAIQAYARQAKNKDLEIDAVEIRIRAECRMAELRVRKGYKRGPGRGKKGSRGERGPFPTNKELGISDDLSARAEKLAELPPKVFEQKLKTWRERVQQENERVTINILKIGDKRQKHVRGTFGTSENDWYTPAEYLELARKVMGGIDLDPASSDFGQQTVQAREYFTPIENGLERTWHGRIWLNPPYSQPDVALFISKLISELRAGHLTAAILLTHNYTDTSWFHEAATASSAICFTRGRVKFHNEEGNVCAPTQGQAFFYFGGDVAAFATHFRDVGFIVLPYGDERD